MLLATENSELSAKLDVSELRATNRRGLLRRLLDAAMATQARKAEEQVKPWIALFEKADRRQERQRRRPTAPF